MCILAASIGISAASETYPVRKRHFDIEPGALSAGLQTFSKQSDVQIITLIDLSHRRNGRVRGDFEPQTALTRLISGQGLAAELVAGGFILRPAKTAPTQPASPSPPPVAQVSEVVVTGYRESVVQAIDLKRRAVNTEDIILAQDIADFPDLNLAESLQRIPGVTISRDSGEGRQITLRGLGPDFTRTQLNGMEVLANTASGMDNRGGVSRTRAFDYSLFASELFDKVVVQKSYSTDQDEGGIGGTVQLFTAKPFDYPGFKAVLSGQLQDNVNTDNGTPRAVGLVSNRWGDFGVLVSVAYSVNDSNEYGYRSYGWGQIHVDPANIGPGVSTADAARLEATGPNEIYAPQADTYSSWFDRRSRLGTTLALQYEPGSRLKLGFDFLFSQLKNDRSDYALAASGSNSLTGDITGTQVIQSDVIKGNSLVASSYTGVDLRSEFNVEQDTTNFYQEVLHGSYEVNDKLLVRGLLGHSEADYALPVFDKVFLESPDQGFSFDYRPSMPVNTYGSDATNPNAWSLMRLDTQENYISSEYTNGKIDAEYTIDSSSKLQIGIAYKKFVNSGSQYNDKVFHNVPADTPISNALKGQVPFDTLGQYIVGDVNQTYALIGQTRDIDSATYAAPGANYTVIERTLAAYLQYNLKAELFDHHVRADAGLRYYSTNLDSSGALSTGTALQPVDIKHTYGDLLPALNIAIDITPRLVARFSANRDISRPALSDLAAAGALTTAPFGGTISIGNPNLKPFLADEVESSLEYYDHHVGFFSAGLFYKNMESFITTQTTVEPYSVTGFPLSYLLPGQGGATPYNVSRPVNGPGAEIKGVEVAVQRDFDFLPAPFNHFGIVINGTYADGSTPIFYGARSIDLPLIYLSNYTANATLYYETSTWGMRISTAYRSKYLDGAGTNGNIGDFMAATNNLDFDSHYNLTPRLKITFEGINLTDQHIVQYTDVIAKRTEVNTSAGQTFVIGATYEF
ncbi:TonB-dependent receptor [Caulobacter sp. S45]|uniref:TonB-dependent receptor n=1 Tax=Caulobacter sp. S45 TaxID=1641861 RepID=UPI0020B106FA|nr:TonB-dependent receptor [Caulobacter sp. S45]